MWELLRRFSRLDPAARGLFLRASALLPWIALNLRLRGFQATQTNLKKRLLATQSPVLPANSAELGRRTSLAVRMVRSAAYRSLATLTCLEKSLTLWWLLSRQGIPSNVRIGVRKGGEKLEAHAWVECDGVPLNEPEELHEHYFAFDEYFPILEQKKK
jgi:hypothetical protein